MTRWKEIAGYEGLYIISDRGDVVALPKTVRDGNRPYRRKAQLMKKGTRGNDGFMYEFVVLTKNKERKHCSVHRLVAEAFIPNPDGLPEVNHKDENPLNNNASNLEWCTRQYNIEYSKGRAVEQLNGGSVIARFKSIARAGRETGIGRKSIQQALSGKSRTAGGYEWRYC